MSRQFAKVPISAKHKKSAEAMRRKQEKEEKSNIMSVDSTTTTTTTTTTTNIVDKTPIQLERERLDRKKLNKHKVAYKSARSLSITGKHGPRAINAK